MVISRDDALFEISILIHTKGFYNKLKLNETCGNILKEACPHDNGCTGYVLSHINIDSYVTTPNGYTYPLTNFSTGIIRKLLKELKNE